VLFDRQGRALAVLEAKSTSVDLSSGEKQGRRYAGQLGVSFIFLSNGEDVWFQDAAQDAHYLLGQYGSLPSDSFRVRVVTTTEESGQKEKSR
jgi:type I site-specific restriction endonuclease